MQIFTIGYSTHTIEDFIALLKQYEITELIDIRTIPNQGIILNLMGLSSHMQSEAIILGIDMKKN